MPPPPMTRSVLFIGAVDQIPPGMLNRVKVTEHLRMIWPSTPAGDKGASQDGERGFHYAARPGLAQPHGHGLHR